jgi:hypothetical protein
MNSTIGRSCWYAAPVASPAKPASVIGVSITRFSPNSSSRPLVICGWSGSGVGEDEGARGGDVGVARERAEVGVRRRAGQPRGDLCLSE